MSNNIELCWHYGYDLTKRKPLCEKKHLAGLNCHSKRVRCPDYLATSEMQDKLKQRRIWVKEG